MPNDVNAVKPVFIDLSMNGIGYDKSISEHYGIEKITNSSVILNVSNGSISGSVNKLLSNCDELYHTPLLVTKSNVKKLEGLFTSKSDAEDKLLNLNNVVSVNLYDSFGLFSLKHLGALINAPSLVSSSYLQEGCLSFIEDGEMVHYLLKDPFSFMNDASLNLMNVSDKDLLIKELDDINTKHNAGYKNYVLLDSLLPKIDKGVSEGVCFKLPKRSLTITKGISSNPLFRYLFNNGSDTPNVELEELLRERSIQSISFGLENEAYLKDRKNILFAISRSNHKYNDADASKNFGIINLLYLNGFDTSRLGSYIQIEAKNWVNSNFQNNRVRAVLTRVPLMLVLDQMLANPQSNIRTNLDKRLSSISFNSKPNNALKIGDAYGCLNYDLDTCNKIIDLYNVYGKFGKQLYHGAVQKLYLNELINEQTTVDANKLLNEVILFKKLNPDDTRLNKLCYNSDLASIGMKQEMIDSYVHSPKSLEQLSIDLSRKYGLNVSASTISSHARKHYDALTSKEFKNRREVQEYYGISSKSADANNTIPQSQDVVNVKQ